jgi:hypothetical protein
VRNGGGDVRAPFAGRKTLHAGEDGSIDESFLDREGFVLVEVGGDER